MRRQVSIAFATIIAVAFSSLNVASLAQAQVLDSKITQSQMDAETGKALGAALAEALQPSATENAAEILKNELSGSGYKLGVVSEKIETTLNYPGGIDPLTGRLGTTSEPGSMASVETGVGNALERAVKISAPGFSTRTNKNGAITAKSSRPSETLVGQVTPTGGQLIYVMNDASASNTLTMNIGTSNGVKWASNMDGSIELLDKNGDSIWSIDTPWAIDASGKTLPTRFVAKGNKLTQVIDTRGAQYPVVADPSWWDWAQNATVCAAGLASLLVVAAKVASIGTKIYNALKGAKYGTAVYRAYKAWLALGGSNATRAKSLLNAIAAFAKRIASSGITSAKSLLKSSYANQYAVIYNATGVVVTMLGLGSCVWIMQQAF